VACSAEAEAFSAVAVATEALSAARSRFSSK